MRRLRNNLSADYVVSGAYLSIGEGPGQKVRLDLRLQDTRNGELVASASDTRTMLQLVNLVTNAGALLRRQLNAGSAGDADSASVRGSVPESAEAARNYSEGLERLRTFDTLGARELLRNAVNAAPGHALSHAALAAASSLLGYDVEARTEAKKALDLSAGLRREEHLAIEGQYFETTHAWDKAVATYQTLRNEYPDNLEYGLRLAAAETQARRGPAGAANHSLIARNALRRSRSTRGPCGGGGFAGRVRFQIRPGCGGARRAIRYGAGHARAGGSRAPDREPDRAGIRRSAELTFRRPHSRSSYTWRLDTGRA